MAAPVATKCCIVGGSLNSLILAGALINKGLHPNEIVVLESSSQIGGQFRSEQFSDKIWLDQGTRILYESDISEVNDFIHQIVSACPSTELKGNRKDIAGTFVNGCLSTTSVYPNLPTDDSSALQRMLGEIFLQLLKVSPNESSLAPGSVKKWLISRFGLETYKLIFRGFLTKIFGGDPNEISDRFVTSLPLDRVVVYDHETMLDFCKSDLLRERLAFPDQLKLPDLRASEFSGFYPESLGVQRLVDCAMSILQSLGVRVLTNSPVVGLDYSDESITVILQNSSVIALPADGFVVWLSNMSVLANCASSKPAVRESYAQMAVAHFMATNVEALDETYYVYVYDASSNIFRITNYAGFCKATREMISKPITVEYLIHHRGVEDHEIIANVQHDLEKMGLFGHSELSPLTGPSLKTIGFPTPRLDSERTRTENLNDIRAKFPNHLWAPGLHSDLPNFLGRDVLGEILRWVDSDVSKG